LIERHNASARVDHEEDDVGFPDGQLGLLAHAVFERTILDVFVAGCVQHAERQVGDPALRLATVTGYAGRVVDERNLAPDQSVEKGRLANIGAADNGQCNCHADPLGRGYSATGSSTTSAGASPSTMASMVSAAASASDS